MSAESGPETARLLNAERSEREALVKVARKLEAKMARRRKVLGELRELDDEIRQARKLIRDLTTPLPGDVYAPPGDDAAQERAERADAAAAAEWGRVFPTPGVEP